MKLSGDRKKYIRLEKRRKYIKLYKNLSGDRKKYIRFGGKERNKHEKK